jgi:hypothetical protein
MGKSSMDRDRDDFSGRYTETFPLESFIEAVEEFGRASTTQVAEQVGCSYDLAYRRLNQLRENGEIEGDKLGGSYHWRISE